MFPGDIVDTVIYVLSAPQHVQVRDKSGVEWQIKKLRIDNWLNYFLLKSMLISIE